MTALAKPQVAAALSSATSVRKDYLESLNLVERLHRQLLDVIKDELDRRDEREINSVQALLLFNVGDQELTAGELRTRGHYLGSNVSYNLKKLVEGGYIHHERSEADRRSVLVRLTRKGEAVRDMLRELFERHLVSLEAVGNVGTDRLGEMMVRSCAMARHLEARVRSEPELELASGAQLNIVCFRYRGKDGLNSEIVADMQEAGIAAPSLTTLNGRVAIRACFINHRTAIEDVDALVEATLTFGRRRSS